MGKKPLLGIDIGNDRLKMVLVQGQNIKKSVVVDLATRMIKDGKLISVETLGEMIRQTMREYGIRCKDAAVTLPEDFVFMRTVTMPVMTEEQLKFNLPFEFKDYITDELKNYVFDYAMISDTPELKKKGKAQLLSPGDTMELLASACPVHVIEEYREMLRKAGLKLTICAPGVSAYSNLFRNLEKLTKKKGEYGILDLGYESVRLYMFSGDTHKVTRALELGMKDVENVVAEIFEEDSHIAHTYLQSNYEDCQNAPEVIAKMTAIAVELQRALNFYRFSNPDIELKDVWICGGGVGFEGFVTVLKETLDVDLHQIDELYASDMIPEQGYLFAESYGITQQ